MSTVSIIAVEDVEATSLVLQELFDWKSSHGGPEFDDLVDKNNRSVLWLHSFEADDHKRFRGAKNKERGVGSSLYVLVEDIEATYVKAQSKLESISIVEELFLNTNAQFQEFTFKLKDGYQFTACEKGPYLKI